jgi:hypothetical protein
MATTLQEQLRKRAQAAGMLSQLDMFIEIMDYASLAAYVRTEGNHVVSELNQNSPDALGVGQRYAFDALVAPSDECEDVHWLHQLQELYQVIPTKYRMEARRILRKR